MALAAGDESGGWWNEARHEARRLRSALLVLSNGDETELLGRALDAARLSVRRRPVGDALLCGAHAVLDHEAEAIWIRDTASPGEYRLFAAHELAHFFLHGGAGGGDLWQTGCFSGELDFSAPDDALVIVGYGPAQRRETEANVWAREFLLPAHLAHVWFTNGLTAQQIARRAGLPLSVAYVQLALGLTSQNKAVQENALPAPAAIANEPTPEISAPPPLTLDESQRKAAAQAVGPTLTHAGPGTGKTRTLTARVLFLTEEQAVRPEHILVLTFARKAAGELRERIALYAPQTARRVFISTFHAYGYDLLRRFAQSAGLLPRPVLLEKADAFALMERHLAACDLHALRYLHDPTFPLRDLLNIINGAKEEGIGPEELAVRAQQSGDPKHEEAARVFAAYEAALLEHGALDYSDLVGRAVRLLQTNADVQNAERAQWQHVLVDEYQDVNRGGAHLLQALTGDGRGLWAVGDVRQAIYQFRGASPANVARFDRDFPGGTRTDLAVNYRSAPPIVGLIGTACGEGAATWQAARDAENAPSFPHALLAVAGDERAQWDGIARKMRQFMQTGYAPGDMAVLCRTNNQAKEARAMLSVRGVPVASVGGGDENGAGGLLAPPDAKKLLALLSRGCEPDSPARHHFPEISDEVLQSVGGENNSGDAYDFLADALWGRLGWARTLQSPAVAAALLNLARTFRDRVALITGQSDDDPAATTTNTRRQAFLDHLRRMAFVGSPSLALPHTPAVANDGGESAEKEPGLVASSTVRVMTVHAAKGLEFPVVFVPNLSAGKFPSRPAPALISPVPAPPPPSSENQSSSDDSQTPCEAVDPEEARLFFVALSRAQNVLVLTRAEKYNNRRFQSSPLLACLENAQNAGLLHGEVWPAALQTKTANAAPDEGAAEILSDAPPPVTVEAWEVDLYLRCPRRYYFERVAGLAPRQETSPYQAFKRVVDTALGAATARDAAAILSDSWAKNDLLTGHSYAPLYQNAAQTIIRRYHGETEDKNVSLPQPVPFVVEREHGDIVVRAAPLPSGGLECRTFRKAPSSGSPDVELRHVLAQEAAPEGSPALLVRYLQTGDVLPSSPSPTARKQNLARADRALQGIRLRVFGPDPAKPNECPACPYFFVCP